MDEPIEDGVGERGVLEPRVPVFERQLAGDYGRTRADAIVEHFEQIVARALIEILQAPVVQDQHVDLRELRQPAAEAAVAVRDLQFLEQPRNAHVEHREALAARLLTERACEPGLARARWPGQDQVLRVAHPVAAAQRGDDALV